LLRKGEPWQVQKYRSEQEADSSVNERFLQELEALQWMTTNETTRFLVGKLREKHELKAQLEAMDQYADDVAVYQPMKQLGILVAVHDRARQPISLEDGSFQLDEGDEFIDLHLPPLGDRTNLAGQARESFALLAEYLEQHRDILRPKYIMGSTYEALAQLAVHFGFETADIPIPDDLRQAIERVYAKTYRGQSGRPMGSIQLVYQSTESFLKRFRPIHSK
jgi:hypothetical protein